MKAIILFFYMDIVCIQAIFLAMQAAALKRQLSEDKVEGEQSHSFQQQGDLLLTLPIMKQWLENNPLKESSSRLTRETSVRCESSFP